jgi:hypothetical protein
MVPSSSGCLLHLSPTNLYGQTMTDPDGSASVPVAVGIGVVDRGYNDESQAEGTRREVQDWLHRVQPLNEFRNPGD